jgi:hypothetical protein
VRVRFFGYGPGRFFEDDELDGSGTFLRFPSRFDEDRVATVFLWISDGPSLKSDCGVVNGYIEIGDVFDKLCGDWNRR